MKTNRISQTLVCSLFLCLSQSLVSCEKIEQVNTEAKATEFALELNFQSSSAIGNIVVYAFDQSGLFVNSWQRKSAEPFSVLLERGNYTFATWSNLRGVLSPSLPVKGVTKLNHIEVVNQSQLFAIGQPLLFGVSQNVNHTKAESLTIPIETLGEPISFTVGVSPWE